MSPSEQLGKALLPCLAELMKYFSRQLFHSILWREQNCSLWPVGLSLPFIILPSRSSVLEDVEWIPDEARERSWPSPALLSGETCERLKLPGLGGKRLAWWQAVGIDRKLKRNVFPLISPPSLFSSLKLKKLKGNFDVIVLHSNWKLKSRARLHVSKSQFCHF